MDDCTIQEQMLFLSNFGRRPNTDKLFVQRRADHRRLKMRAIFEEHDPEKWKPASPNECRNSVTRSHPSTADETMAPATTLFSHSADDSLKPSPATVVLVRVPGSAMRGDVSLIHRLSCRSSLLGMHQRPLAG
jgi:hypothetical protein